MKCITIISVVAFAVIFLSALFLFMRNYPSDRWFSVVFIVAGGVSLWCVWGADAAGDAAGEAEATGTMTALQTEAVMAEDTPTDTITKTVPINTETS